MTQADSGPEQRRQALMASALFRVLTPAEQAHVLAHAVTRRFARNATVLRKGDEGTGMLIVLQGRLRVGVVTEDGQEVALNVLGPGDLIGEIALLDGGARSADVTALEDCQLLMVPRGYFLQLMQSNVDLCLRVVQVLCARLRRANASLEEIATLNLPARLGRLLLRLADQYGTDAAGARRIDLKVSQKDLGQLIAASREKVNKQLQVWRGQGVIRQEGGYLTILRPERLLATEEE